MRPTQDITEESCSQVRGEDARPYQDQGEDHGFGNQERRDYRMKMDLPSFNDHPQTEDFLDWVIKVESFWVHGNPKSQSSERCLNAHGVGWGSWWGWFLPLDYHQDLFKQKQEWWT